MVNYKSMFKLIAKLSILLMFVLFFFSYTKAEEINSRLNSKKIEITKGKYMGHKWYIDETHVMYWDGQPYIPHALTGPKFYKNITKTYAEIDDRIQKGVTDFLLWYEGDQDKLGNKCTTKEYNNWIDQATDYITRKVRMDSHNGYIPYLYAVSGDYIDGVTPEYNAFTPDDVRQMMSDSPYIRYFNSFSKTKVMWTNLQVSFGTTTTWPPYVSKQVLWDHHRIAVENGATGNLLDMGDYQWQHLKLAGRSLADTHKWYGEIKDELKNHILEKARTKEFITGKYAPSKNLEFRYKSPTLSRNKVVSILIPLQGIGV